MKYRPLQLTAIVGVLALASFGRFYHLAHHDLRGDEAFSILFAQENWAALIAYLGSGEPHPPLYFSTLKVWMGIAGQTEFATRWLSAAAGIVTVAWAFKVGERLNGYGTGLAAALIAGVNPTLIWNAQDVRMYAVGTAFATGLIYWGLRFLDDWRPATTKDGLGLALFAILAAFTHYVAAVVVGVVYGVLAVRVLFDRKVCKSWRPLLVSAGVVAVAYAPWLAYAASILGPGYGGNMKSPVLFDALRTVFVGWTAGWLGTAGLWDAFLYSTVTLVVIALILTGRRHPWGTALLLAFVVVPVLALFVASLFRPVFSDRYLLFSAPALCTTLGAGLAAGGGLLPRRLSLARLPFGLVAIAAAVVYLGATGQVLSNYFRDRGGDGPGTWRPFVVYFEERVRPDDLVLVNHLDPAFGYYYRLLGVPAPSEIAPARAGATEPSLDADLQHLMSPGRHVWLAQDSVHYWDPTGVAAAWLERHSVKIGTEVITGKPVLHFRVPGGSGLNVDFGDRLRLERVEVRARDGALAAGSTAAVDLVWRAVKPLAVDYTISLQLIAADGTLVTQSDAYPRQGTVPTSEIRVTESIVDIHLVALPLSPGNYRLALAVYDLNTMQRLSVAGTRDNLLLLANLAVVAH